MIKTLWKSLSKTRQIFCVLLILFTLFRIFLFLRTPLDAMGNTPHDDLLLLNHAQSLIQGNWLGDYNNTTLVKGISFPLFVAVCNWLCIPYMLGVAFLYIGSILLFLQAIRPITGNFYLQSLIYLFLLYSPAMLSKSTGQRPYNMTLIPSAILLVTGTCIGLFLRRTRSPRKLLPWGLASGAGLSFFWYVREDSIWLMPFVVISLGISIFCILRLASPKKEKLTAAGLMTLPLWMLLAASLTISGINHHFYGTFTTNERTKTSFSQVMSDLVQLDSPQVRQDVWVSRETVDKAMMHSPTLAFIRTSIDKIYESSWAVEGEISGDIIAWALRDAAADAGYFTDGAVSRSFFQSVHKELQKAYENGSIQKKPGIFLSSLSDGFVFSEDFSPLALRSAKTWKRLLFCEGTEVEIFPGTGTTWQLRFFEALTASPVVYPDSDFITNDPVGEAVQRPVVYSQRILKIWKPLTYPLALVSALLYLWMTFSMIRELQKKMYDIWYRWLITTGLAGCCAVLIVEVCWFTTYLGEAANTVYHYCTGALTMIQLVQIFTLITGAQMMGKKRKVREVLGE